MFEMFEKTSKVPFKKLSQIGQLFVVLKSTKISLFLGLRSQLKSAFFRLEMNDEKYSQISTLVIHPILCKNKHILSKMGCKTRGKLAIKLTKC